jgi:RNA polymerase sigma-70 factor (ECF subfamily)
MKPRPGAAGARKKGAGRGTVVAATPLSLLDRLQGQPAQADWQRLVELYTPLLRDWLCRHPALRQEADDLVQEILRSVVAKVPEFRRQRAGSFRRWLQVITVNRVNLYWRSHRGRPPAVGGYEAEFLLADLADPDRPLDHAIDQEYNRYVLRRLVQLIEAEFRPQTWRAFQRHVLDGLPPVAVAAELGVSENAVLIARSRVLKRLREEAQGLTDEGAGD